VALALDASALVYAIRSPAPSAARLRRRLGQETSHAPQLIDAELGNVLRRHVLAGALPASEAKTLLSAGATLVDRAMRPPRHCAAAPGSCATTSRSMTRSTSPWRGRSTCRC